MNKFPLLRVLAMLALLPCAMASAGVASAAPPAARRSDARTTSAAVDPMAPVFVVMSETSHAGVIGALGRRLAGHRDATGTRLVLAELRNHQLEDLSRHVHAREQRCGGYFAFPTRREAEAFLRGGRVAQALRGKFLAAYTIDNQATVGPWLSQVEERTIRATIAHLSTAWPNRYYASSHGRNAATWIRDTWQGLAAGRSDVSAELFTGCSTCSTQPSVILTIRGSDLPDEIVVLGGHLDSIRQNNPGSVEGMLAPGADDDASGIATLTEILRVAMANGYRPRRTVMFMGYAAEEVGLRGSRAIAESFRQQGRNVVGVLQLDMTNWKSPSASTDIGLVSDYSNADLLQFTQALFAEYLAPSGYTMGLSPCGYACSDHASWTAAGYPAVMPMEGPIFPYLHTPNDTLAQMGNSASHSTLLARLGLAYLGEVAKSSAARPLPGQVTVRSNDRDVAIPDMGIAESGIMVTRRTGMAPSLVPVAVRIRHPAPAELRVDLVAPSGRTYALVRSAGGGADVVQTWNVDVSAEPMNGAWRLRVEDQAAGNTGGIDRWSISL